MKDPNEIVLKVTRGKLEESVAFIKTELDGESVVTLNKLEEKVSALLADEQKGLVMLILLSQLAELFELPADAEVMTFSESVETVMAGMVVMRAIQQHQFRGEQQSATPIETVPTPS